MDIKHITTTSLLFCIAGCMNTSAKEPQASKPNILFIAVDDLRPELNCYGRKHIVSPNIDKLAASGTMFTNAYCNVPVCGASRASVLTGLRPGMDRFIGFAAYAQNDAPEAIVLPQWFKNNGYTTVNNGKVFHHADDHAECWDENWRSSTPLYASTYGSEMMKKTGKAPIIECADLPDTAYADGQVAAKTIRDLQRLKKQNKPFFLAVGFLKPHLPFNAPLKYWKYYPVDKVKLPENNYAPKNCPVQAIHNNGELRQYSAIPDGPIMDSMAVKLIQGYDACVTYADAMVGQVLDELKRTGLDKNTIVVLWGDHGWNLREHTLWQKHCNFRTSLRSVLIVKGPGIPKEQICAGLVEYVDIYPTLCNLAGLKDPDSIEGKDFTPLLKNPKSDGKPFIISKFGNGLTITTQKYSYTEWIDQNLVTIARMMYDKSTDIEENVNISEIKENQPLVRELSQTMRNNWGENFIKKSNAMNSAKKKPNSTN